MDDVIDKMNEDFAKGSKSIQECLWDYRQFALNIASSKLKGFPDDSLDDVFSLLCEKIVKYGENFRGECKLSTWFYTVTHNCVNEILSYHIKRQRVNRTGVISYDKYIDVSQIEDAYCTAMDKFYEGSYDRGQYTDKLFKSYQEFAEMSFYDVVEGDDLSNLLTDFIFEDLSDKLKSVYISRILEEKSYEQLSEDFKLPIGTVKSRLYNAKTKTARFLEDYGYYDSSMKDYL